MFVLRGNQTHLEPGIPRVWQAGIEPVRKRCDYNLIRRRGTRVRTYEGGEGRMRRRTK